MKAIKQFFPKLGAVCSSKSLETLFSCNLNALEIETVSISVVSFFC